MLVKDQSVSMRTIESPDDLSETRLEAVGYVFHGTMPENNGKRLRAGSNLLHFARCPKLDRAAENETKIWFRTIRIASQHLNEKLGLSRWKWCKVCEREITQRMINE